MVLPIKGAIAAKAAGVGFMVGVLAVVGAGALAQLARQRMARGKAGMPNPGEDDDPIPTERPEPPLRNGDGEA